MMDADKNRPCAKGQDTAVDSMQRGPINLLKNSYRVFGENRLATCL